MSLDASFNLIYGYKVQGNKITKELEKAYNNGKISAKEYDDIYDELTNNTDGTTLYWCEDTMCGNYGYIGLCLFEMYDDYGEDVHMEIDLKNIAAKCNDELLDKLMQEQKWLQDLYDVAGLFDGNLPKLYFVKKVS